ncbi:unnamed protein product [Vitrella brassicaformis CCMP3155]|uniref:Uncharacterized protein n=4 Tax=Vitrella brassicaformis TaxID=1169539 RepID=A0A0G4E9Z5_VITBC|nr:unnamed protein product [Vitrella brassicaformis CCMP3155]|eukprot:CEL92750.1 unnamed protein product [Vitrella brassicaformis CCMP3155]
MRPKLDMAIVGTVVFPADFTVGGETITYATDGWQRVTFERPFPVTSRVVVIATPQPYTSSHRFLLARVRDVTPFGFLIALQDEQDGVLGSPLEDITVGYIAIERQGPALASSIWEAGFKEDRPLDSPSGTTDIIIDFEQPFDNTNVFRFVQYTSFFANASKSLKEKGFTASQLEAEDDNNHECFHLWASDQPNGLLTNSLLEHTHWLAVQSPSDPTQGRSAFVMHSVLSRHSRTLVNGLASVALTEKRAPGKTMARVKNGQTMQTVHWHAEKAPPQGISIEVAKSIIPPEFTKVYVHFTDTYGNVVENGPSGCTNCSATVTFSHQACVRFRNTPYWVGDHVPIEKGIGHFEIGFDEAGCGGVYWEGVQITVAHDTLQATKTVVFASRVLYVESLSVPVPHAGQTVTARIHGATYSDLGLTNEAGVSGTYFVLLSGEGGNYFDNWAVNETETTIAMTDGYGDVSITLRQSGMLTITPKDGQGGTTTIQKKTKGGTQILMIPTAKSGYYMMSKSIYVLPDVPTKIVTTAPAMAPVNQPILVTLTANDAYGEFCPEVSGNLNIYLRTHENRISATLSFLPSPAIVSQNIAAGTAIVAVTHGKAIISVQSTGAGSNELRLGMTTMTDTNWELAGQTPTWVGHEGATIVIEGAVALTGRIVLSVIPSTVTAGQNVSVTLSSQDTGGSPKAITATVELVFSLTDGGAIGPTRSVSFANQNSASISQQLTTSGQYNVSMANPSDAHIDVTASTFVTCAYGPVTQLGLIIMNTVLPEYDVGTMVLLRLETQDAFSNHVPTRQDDVSITCTRNAQQVFDGDCGRFTYLHEGYVTFRVTSNAAGLLVVSAYSTTAPGLIQATLEMSFGLVVYDKPSVTLTIDDGKAMTKELFTILTASFSEGLQASSFTVDDITVSNATVDSLVALDAAESLWRIVVTLQPDRNASFFIAADVVVGDLSGLSNAPSNTVFVANDQTPPVGSVAIDDTAPYIRSTDLSSTNGTVPILIIANEPIAIDITKLATPGLSIVSHSPRSGEYATEGYVLVLKDSVGSLVVEVPPGLAADRAGNLNVETFSITVAYRPLDTRSTVSEIKIPGTATLTAGVGSQLSLLVFGSHFDHAHDQLIYGYLPPSVQDPESLDAAAFCLALAGGDRVTCAQGENDTSYVVCGPVAATEEGRVGLCYCDASQHRDESCDADEKFDIAPESGRVIIVREGCAEPCGEGYECETVALDTGGFFHSCQPHCGDAFRTIEEACDDGNDVSGDGCSGDCLTIEDGWTCSVVIGQPSICTRISMCNLDKAATLPAGWHRCSPDNRPSQDLLLGCYLVDCALETTKTTIGCVPAPGEAYLCQELATPTLLAVDFMEGFSSLLVSFDLPIAVSYDGTTVTAITANSPTDLCYTFVDDSRASFGTDPSCLATSNRTIGVFFGDVPTARVGDMIHVKSGTIARAEAAFSDVLQQAWLIPEASHEVGILSGVDLPVLSAVVQKKPIYSICEGVHVDVYFSGGSGRPIDIQWTCLEPTEACASLNQHISAENGLSDTHMSVTSDHLRAAVDQQTTSELFVFRLTAANFLGSQFNEEIEIDVDLTDNITRPNVVPALDSPSEMSLHVDKAIVLRVALEASRCPESGTQHTPSDIIVDWLYRQTMPQSSELISLNNTSGHQLKLEIAPGFFETYSSYVVVARVAYRGNPESSADVDFVVHIDGASTPRVSLSGPTSVSATCPFALHYQATAAQTDSSLAFRWHCFMLNGDGASALQAAELDEAVCDAPSGYEALGLLKSSSVVFDCTTEAFEEGDTTDGSHKGEKFVQGGHLSAGVVFFAMTAHLERDDSAVSADGVAVSRVALVDEQGLTAKWFSSVPKRVSFRTERIDIVLYSSPIDTAAAVPPDCQPSVAQGTQVEWLLEHMDDGTLTIENKTLSEAESRRVLLRQGVQDSAQILSGVVLDTSLLTVGQRYRVQATVGGQTVSSNSFAVDRHPYGGKVAASKSTVSAFEAIHVEQSNWKDDGPIDELEFAFYRSNEEQLSPIRLCEFKKAIEGGLTCERPLPTGTWRVYGAVRDPHVYQCAMTTGEKGDECPYVEITSERAAVVGADEIASTLDAAVLMTGDASTILSACSLAVDPIAQQTEPEKQKELVNGLFNAIQTSQALAGEGEVCVASQVIAEMLSSDLSDHFDQEALGRGAQLVADQARVQRGSCPAEATVARQSVLGSLSSLTEHRLTEEASRGCRQAAEGVVQDFADDVYEGEEQDVENSGLRITVRKADEQQFAREGVTLDDGSLNISSGASTGASCPIAVSSVQWAADPFSFSPTDADTSLGHVQTIELHSACDDRQIDIDGERVVSFLMECPAIDNETATRMLEAVAPPARRQLFSLPGVSTFNPQVSVSGPPVEPQVTYRAVTECACMFFDEARGNWSQEGCYELENNGTHLRCGCDHLTSFVAAAKHSVRRYDDSNIGLVGKSATLFQSMGKRPAHFVALLFFMGLLLSPCMYFTSRDRRDWRPPHKRRHIFFQDRYARKNMDFLCMICPPFRFFGGLILVAPVIINVSMIIRTVQYFCCFGWFFSLVRRKPKPFSELPVVGKTVDDDSDMEEEHSPLTSHLRSKEAAQRAMRDLTDAKIQKKDMDETPFFEIEHKEYRDVQARLAASLLTLRSVARRGRRYKVNEYNAFDDKSIVSASTLPSTADGRQGAQRPSGDTPWTIPPLSRPIFQAFGLSPEKELELRPQAMQVAHAVSAYSALKNDRRADRLLKGGDIVKGGRRAHKKLTKIYTKKQDYLVKQKQMFLALLDAQENNTAYSKLRAAEVQLSTSDIELQKIKYFGPDKMSRYLPPLGAVPVSIRRMKKEALFLPQHDFTFEGEASEHNLVEVGNISGSQENLFEDTRHLLWLTDKGRILCVHPEAAFAEGSLQPLVDFEGPRHILPIEHSVIEIDDTKPNPIVRFFVRRQTDTTTSSHGDSSIVSRPPSDAVTEKADSDVRFAMELSLEMANPTGDLRFLSPVPLFARRDYSWKPVPSPTSSAEGKQPSWASTTYLIGHNAISSPLFIPSTSIDAYCPQLGLCSLWLSHIGHVLNILPRETAPTLKEKSDTHSRRLSAATALSSAAQTSHTVRSLFKLPRSALTAVRGAGREGWHGEQEKEVQYTVYAVFMSHIKQIKELAGEESAADADQGIKASCLPSVKLLVSNNTSLRLYFSHQVFANAFATNMSRLSKADKTNKPQLSRKRVTISYAPEMPVERSLSFSTKLDTPAEAEAGALPRSLSTEEPNLRIDSDFWGLFDTQQSPAADQEFVTTAAHETAGDRGAEGEVSPLQVAQVDDFFDQPSPKSAFRPASKSSQDSPSLRKRNAASTPASDEADSPRDETVDLVIATSYQSPAQQGSLVAPEASAAVATPSPAPILVEDPFHTSEQRSAMVAPDKQRQEHQQRQQQQHEGAEGDNKDAETDVGRCASCGKCCRNVYDKLVRFEEYQNDHVVYTWEAVNLRAAISQENKRNQNLILAKRLQYHEWPAGKVIYTVAMREHPLPKTFPYNPVISRTQRYAIEFSGIMTELFISSLFFNAQCAYSPSPEVCFPLGNPFVISWHVFFASLWAVVLAVPVPLFLRFCFAKRIVEETHTAAEKEVMLLYWRLKDLLGYAFILTWDTWCFYFLMVFILKFDGVLVGKWYYSGALALAHRMITAPVIRSLWVSAVLLISKVTWVCDFLLLSCPALIAFTHPDIKRIKRKTSAHKLESDKLPRPIMPPKPIMPIGQKVDESTINEEEIESESDITEMSPMIIPRTRAATQKHREREREREEGRTAAEAYDQFWSEQPLRFQ